MIHPEFAVEVQEIRWYQIKSYRESNPGRPVQSLYRRAIPAPFVVTWIFYFTEMYVCRVIQEHGSNETVFLLLLHHVRR
jgi:hypothetical protein